MSQSSASADTGQNVAGSIGARSGDGLSMTTVLGIVAAVIIGMFIWFKFGKGK